MNLSQTSKFFKTGVFVLGFTVIFYYVFSLFLYPQTKRVIRQIISKRNPPNVMYGQLEQLEFIEKQMAASVPPKIVLETKSGSLPDNFPDRMYVYKVRANKFSYMATGNAIKDAALLGYKEDDLVTDLKGPRFRWRSILTNSVLNIDSASQYLSISMDLKNMIGNTKGGLDTTLAQKYAVDLFQQLGRIDNSYTTGRTVSYIGTFINTNIVEAQQGEEGDIARIEMFRKIGKYDVYNPDPNKGLLRVYMRNPQSISPLNYPILEAYFHEIIEPAQATYPIIEVEQAWEAVKAGKGIVASIKPKNANPFEELTNVGADRFTINNIKLAYYETMNTTTHLQPIYVFEGFYTRDASVEGDVVIYYPAIQGEYTKK